MLLPHLFFVPIKQTSSFFQKEKYNSFQYYTGWGQMLGSQSFRIEGNIKVIESNLITEPSTHAHTPRATHSLWASRKFMPELNTVFPLTSTLCDSTPYDSLQYT